jgi:hypothetical protein
MSTIDDFVATEKAAKAKAREEYLKEQDYKDFIKWPQGVTGFQLEAVIPRENTSFGTLKKVFRITVDGVEYDWSVNPLSPMYVQILDKLLEAPVGMQINRLGEGLETRYSLL